MTEVSNKTTKSTHGAFVGKVVSDKQSKTRVVEVRSHKVHPKYKKIYTTTKRFMVHDEQNSSQVGDRVTFVPARPHSRTKKFVILDKENK